MRRALAVVLAGTLLALASIGVRAQAPTVDVVSNTAQSQFPNGIAFALQANVSAPAEDVRLVYEIAPDGVRATARPDCIGDTSLSCRYQLGGGQATLLIPGAVVTYSWGVTINGQTSETPTQSVTYEDTRFNWQTLTDGPVTLYYYSQGEDDARAVLAAGRDSLDRFSTLLQTSVDFPVKIYYYASAEDMAPAIMSDNAQGVITLGEVATSDTAMVAADSSPEDIARHEIAHIVVRQAVPPPYKVPDWLNEGLAVYAQSAPLGGQRSAIEDAIRSGDVLSVRSLSSASSGSQANKVFLFYGESWSIVKFLIETYGDAKFADLFRAYHSGADTRAALISTYGLTEDSLENAWRASVGLPPRQVPTPASSNAQEPTSTAAASSSDSDRDSGSIILIIAIGVITTVLAVGLFALGAALARRYR
jgi:hypothetical protein